jgi:general secretion pathway protein E
LITNPEYLPNLTTIIECKQDVELALKNQALFTTHKNQATIAINNRYYSQAFNYISKLDTKYEIIVLDDISYDNLYKRYLELKADKDIEQFDDSDEFDSLESNEDISISEFLQTSSDILDSSDSAPIIKFVNSLFYQAVKLKASDIHIEPHEKKGEVRFRVNGTLSTHVSLDTKIINFVISRIKVISHLDISEKRIPQDGRTAINLGGTNLDIRVSVLPTYYGERVVMRILMNSSDIPKLDNIGLQQNIIESLKDTLSASYGIILVTGPTGSGKSTTLHSLLQHIYSPEKNILTIEDPVEYKSDNINQIQVHSKVGLTFASGLRSILRQDPDVIMIGEIRDSETASIAIQAALTGHLVFSTLHTNTATAALTRLIDMGVEKFLATSALLGVLSQRLVRTLCEDCKIEDENSQIICKTHNLKPTNIYRPTGCVKCNNTGYTSRVAIGEFFKIDESIKIALKDDIDDTTLRDIAVKNGLIPLKDSLIELLSAGVTSYEEVVRIGLKDV